MLEKNLYLEQELKRWGQTTIEKMKSVNSHFYISQHSSQSHLPPKFFLCTPVHIDSFMPFLKPHIMNCIYNNYAL